MGDSPSVSKQSERTFTNAQELTGKKPLNHYLTTLTHFLKGYVGTGIFAMGEGFKNSGIIIGIVFLLILAIMNLNCQHILVKMCKKIEEEEGENVKPSFAETVQYSLEGSKLKLLREKAFVLGHLTNIFICVCELGFCCVYFVFVAEHFEKVAANGNLIDPNRPETKHIMLAIIFLPMWSSTFLGNLRLLLPLSIIANLLVWIGICIVFYFTTHDGLPNINERHLVTEVKTWPIYFGITLYAFEGITFVIPLRHEMKKKELFSSLFGVLNIGMMIVSFLYLSVGLLGYWKYGDDVKSSVFLNLIKNDIQLENSINIIMSLAVLFTFTLHMYISFEISYPLFHEKFGPFKWNYLVQIIYKTVLVLFTFTLANVIPFLGLFIALIGATCGAFLALILPALLELVAIYDDLSKLTVAKDVIIMLTGIVGMFTGTVLTIMDIVDAFKKKHS